MCSFKYKEDYDHVSKHIVGYKSGEYVAFVGHPGWQNNPVVL